MAWLRTMGQGVWLALIRCGEIVLDSFAAAAPFYPLSVDADRLPPEREDEVRPSTVSSTTPAKIIAGVERGACPMAESPDGKTR